MSSELIPLSRSSVERWGTLSIVAIDVDLDPRCGR
jgi:hypothetical protein